MALNFPSPLVQRVLRFKAIEIKDGRFLLWKVPGIIMPLYSLLYMQRILEKNLGEKEASSMLYAQGRYQAKKVFKIISDSFGYAKTFSDKQKLLEFNTGQGEMAGWGKWEWKRMDFENNLFILSGRSTLAEEYLKECGAQDHAVDYFGRGSAAGFIEEIINKKVFCVETSCIANGKKSCEFVVRPLSDWDKNDPQFKRQAIKEFILGKE